VAAIARGQARFGDQGIEADVCLVAPAEDADAAIVGALTGAAQRAALTS
jgi:hypothetical protein